MTREIKFRAWDKQEKIMWNQNHIAVISGIVLKYGGHHTGGEKEGLYYMQDETKNLIPMQYTGLKDKNGKEVYEGDILRHDFSPGRFEQIVCIHENMIALILKLRNYKRMSDLNDRFEIIGNIYQDPELLK